MAIYKPSDAYWDAIWRSWEEGRLPEGHYGPDLPEKMQWPGDIFIKELPNGTIEPWIWWRGGWTNGSPPK